MRTPIGDVSTAARAANPTEQQMLINARACAKAVATAAILAASPDIPTPPHIDAFLSELIARCATVHKRLLYFEAARIVSERYGDLRGGVLPPWRAIVDRLRKMGESA